MRSVFHQGYFHAYSQARLDDARLPVAKYSQYAQTKPTVFVSHKHDDLEDLKDIIGFLQLRFGVKVYIDSQDPSLPKRITPTTALTIRQRIVQCNKFILLATNNAIESKWCNWELGYGDAMKYKKHIALFPLKPAGTLDSSYKGTEYMSIYPSIAYYDGTERNDGDRVAAGYYVRQKEGDSYRITPLSEWFRAR